MNYADYVSLEICGLGTLTSKDGDIVEIADVSPAQWRITELLPSDATVTIRMTRSDRVVSVVARSASPTLGRLAYPLLSTDTQATLSGIVGLGVHWLGKEKVEVTNIALGSDYTPSLSVTTATLVRGLDGTRAQRIDLSNNVGPYFYSNAPFSLADCRAIYRLHRKGDPTGEVLLDGVVSEYFDSADGIELTIGSSIKANAEKRWPTIQALHPFADRAFTLNKDSKPSADTTRYRYTPPYSREGWGWDDATRPVSARYFRGVDDNRTYGLRRVLFSTGPRGWPARQGGIGAARNVGHPDIEKFGGQPYGDQPPVADNYGGWRVVALRGPDGYSGQSNPTTNGRDATGDEYIMMRVRPMLNWVSGGGKVTPSDALEAGETQTLGLYGYGLDVPEASWSNNAIRRGALVMAGALVSPWVTADAERLRRRRLSEGDDTRIPGVFKPGSVLRLPIIDDGAPDWFSAQVRVDGLPLVDVDVSVDPHLIDRATLIGALAEIPTTLGISLQDFFDAIDPSISMGDTARAVPPEIWLERSLKETLFEDLRTTLALTFAPRKGGGLRPVWLGRDLDDVVAVTIDETDVRSPDHTIHVTFDSPLTSVRITDLRPVELLKRADWIEGSDDIEATEYAQPGTLHIISSDALDEGASGAKLDPAVSAYHKRDALPQWDDGRQRKSGLLQDIMRLCWSRAIANYGRTFPTVELRIDADVQAWPGDVVRITLGNMVGPDGNVGVTRLRGQVTERGDSVLTGTASVLILLVGWYNYGGGIDV